MKLKITGGEHKGRFIDAPKGLSTRPTSEKLRKTIFDISQNLIEGSMILDLFSGSGALGLEAISRGAKQAYLVDHDLKAISCIEKNITSLNMSSEAVMMKMDVMKAIDHLNGLNIQFDLIFIDPPYALESQSISLAEKVLTKIESTQLLASDGLIFLEEGRYFNLNRCLKGLSRLNLKNQRKAGDSFLFEWVLG